MAASRSHQPESGGRNANERFAGLIATTPIKFQLMIDVPAF
jgi:hypothetical protein